MNRSLLLPVLVGVLLLPIAASAAGGHGKVGCNGCHANKEVMAGNKKLLDPATHQPYAGSTGICLACHETAEAGGKGFLPVSQQHSHPFALASVNPKRAKVPADLMVKDRFGCMSCHDPHPSNGNYKYLRSDVGASGDKMDAFCARCHPLKAGA
jgi:predicted CXXCH cytochrome family protein